MVELEAIVQRGVMDGTAEHMCTRSSWQVLDMVFVGLTTCLRDVVLIARFSRARGL
jgi:hypothetical protein